MAKQTSKQKVAQSQVVCRGLLDCSIVGIRLESFLFKFCLQELSTPFFCRLEPGNFGHLNLSDPFDVKRRRSTYMTEVRAGITTFLAMAYILPVNSGMLSLVIPGKREELVCATALAAFCGCWLMGILSNYPFMLAPGKKLGLVLDDSHGYHGITINIRFFEKMKVYLSDATAAMQFPNSASISLRNQWQAWALMHSSPSLFAWEEVYPIKLPLRQFLWLDASSSF